MLKEHLMEIVFLIIILPVVTIQNTQENILTNNIK